VSAFCASSVNDGILAGGGFNQLVSCNIILDCESKHANRPSITRPSIITIRIHRPSQPRTRSCNDWTDDDGVGGGARQYDCSMIGNGVAYIPVAIDAAGVGVGVVVDGVDDDVVVFDSFEAFNAANSRAARSAICLRINKSAFSFSVGFVVAPLAAVVVLVFDDVDGVVAVAPFVAAAVAVAVAVVVDGFLCFFFFLAAVDVDVTVGASAPSFVLLDDADDATAGGGVVVDVDGVVDGVGVGVTITVTDGGDGVDSEASLVFCIGDIHFHQLIHHQRE
jgi:hypothetical protein